MFDGGKEVEYRSVEDRRLLQVDGVAALGDDNQAGVRQPSFHEEGRLETRLVFIADHDKRWHLQAWQLVANVVDRLAPDLDAAEGVGRAAG